MHWGSYRDVAFCTVPPGSVEFLSFSLALKEFSLVIQFENFVFPR